MELLLLCAASHQHKFLACENLPSSKPSLIVLVAVVRSRSGPDRVEGQQPGISCSQSAVRQQRPAPRGGERSRQEEQPHLPGEEEGKETISASRWRHAGALWPHRLICSLSVPVEGAPGIRRHEQSSVDPHQHPLCQQGGHHRRQPAGLAGRPVQCLQCPRAVHLQRARWHREHHGWVCIHLVSVAVTLTLLGFCVQLPVRATILQERSCWTRGMAVWGEATTPAAWRACWPVSLWSAAPPTAASPAVTARHATTHQRWTKGKVSGTICLCVIMSYRKVTHFSLSCFSPRRSPHEWKDSPGTVGWGGHRSHGGLRTSTQPHRDRIWTSRTVHRARLHRSPSAASRRLGQVRPGLKLFTARFRWGRDKVQTGGSSGIRNVRGA